MFPHRDRQSNNLTVGFTMNLIIVYLSVLYPDIHLHVHQAVRTDRYHTMYYRIGTNKTT